MKATLAILAATALLGIAATKKGPPSLPPLLSAFHLDSDPGFIKYQLSTPLFTDYAEKERRIKLPPATTLTLTGDGLPIFPEGAILVKTFYYWRDKRDTAKGKRLIETRILQKTSAGWQAGTYVWNNEQTEAFLTGTGQRMDIGWTDETGTTRNIRYQVPAASQCGSCHRSDKEITPIGFKIRNLNFPIAKEDRGIVSNVGQAVIKRDDEMIDQLKVFAGKGLIPPVNPSAYASLPAWNDSTQPMENRARAYLDVNCAHCHNEQGDCRQSDFRPAYENTLAQTRIEEKKKRILRFLRSGRMPLLGTTVVHQEGLELIAHYLKNK